MKVFKTIDVWISIILIIAFLMGSLINTNKFLITGYFIVGGWHVISMIIHAATGHFIKTWGQRFVYHWIVVAMLMLFPFTMWLLPFISPFMAIYYTYLCYEETFVFMKRPMELLK